MENKKPSNPIMKMSMLLNILPYYGGLPKWKRLLECISWETNNIWRDHSDAFVYWGRDFKQEVNINIFNQGDDFRNLLKLYSLVFTSDDWLSENTLQILIALLDLLDEGEAIIYHAHKYEANLYTINFWKEESASEILPAIKWPSFKKVQKRISISHLLEIEEFIVKQLEYKSVVIKKENEEIVAYSVLSSTFKFYDSPYASVVITEEAIREITETWESWDWVCRPTKLQIIQSFCFPPKLYKNKTSCFKNVKEIQIDMKCVLKSSALAFYDSIARFRKWNISFKIGDIWSKESKWKGIFSGKYLMFMIDNIIWSFERNDGQNFQQKIDLNYWETTNLSYSLFLMSFSYLYATNLAFVWNSEKDLDNETMNKINNLYCKNTYRILLLAEKKDIVLELKFNDSWWYREYFIDWSKVVIKIDSSFKIDNDYELLKEYPETANYLFEIHDPSNKFITLFSDLKFVEILKRLKAKITCKGVEIEVKEIKKGEEMKIFIDQLKTNIKKKNFRI